MKTKERARVYLSKTGAAVRRVARQGMEWWSRGWKQKGIVIGGGLAVLALIAGFAISLSRNPGVTTFFFGEKDLFEGFSKLVLDDVARDDFQMNAVSEDSLGVEPTSSYILSSKEELTTDEVRQRIAVSPDVPFSLTQRSPTEWELKPAEALTPNAVFTVAMAATADDEESLDYEWAFQVKDRFKVLHYLPRDAATNVPLATGIEVTFSHELFVDYESYISIDPPVPGRFERHGRTLVYVPEDRLAPAQVYRVTVQKGLPLSGSDQTLQDDLVFAFETVLSDDAPTPNDPWLRTYQALQDVSGTEPPLIQLSARNLKNDSVDVDVYPLRGEDEYLQMLDRRDRLPWWSSSKEYYREDVSGRQSLTSFTLPLQEESGVQFIRFSEPLPYGYFLVELKSGNERSQVLVQVTDMAAYLNVAEDRTIVWAADLSTRRPAPGARVELIGTGRQVTANDRGVAVLDTPQEILDSASDYQSNKRYYFKVSSGGHALIIPAMFVSGRYGRWADSSAPDYWSYLYTDRPLYQPTDTLKFWGLLRARDRQRINEPVTLSLVKDGYVDYYYRPIVLETRTINVDTLGTFAGEIPIVNLQPDSYTVELKVGDDVIARKYIQVRSYEKPSYQLRLTPSAYVAYVGDEVVLETQASFFEGTPVPELPLVFKVDGVIKEHVVTDTDGKAIFRYTKEYQDCTSDYGCWPAYAWVTVEPEMSEIAEVSADARLHFYGPQVDARTTVTYPEKEQGRLEVAVHMIDMDSLSEGIYQDPETLPASAGTRVEGEVVRVSYTRTERGTGYDFINKRTYKTYSYSRNQETVDHFDGLTNDQGMFVYERELEPDVSYQIQLRYYDAEGRYENAKTYMYYYDGRRLNRHDESEYDFYRLKLPEDNHFSVGEQVRIEFVNNDVPLQSGGDNYYLFMQQQNGLQEYGVSQESTYQFAFEQRDIPNVNVAGVYFNGETFVPAETGWTGNSILFDRNDKKLQIDITPDKNQYEPGEDVTVSIRTRDAAGKPVSSAVNLNLIDEAFYAVMDDYANPIDSIYSGLGSGSIFSAYSHHRPVTPYGGAEKGGCFLAGTEIRMADGRSIPIEDIRVGDEVLTLVDPRTDETDSGVVTELYRHVVSEYLIINHDVRVTPEHLVYANLGFKPAGDLKIGDWMLRSDGSKTFVTSIEPKREVVRVYNFRVEPYHTYFADGYFVHNEKGGGPREFFTDAALFKTVTTNGSGLAQTTFTLPDNITSWRVTAQGISSGLDVGVSVSKIPVSLPAFVEVGIGGEYVSDDSPIARLRSYGTAFTGTDDVTLGVLSPDLDIQAPLTKRTKAFQSAFFNLPTLTVGSYDVTYQLESDQGGDAVTLPLHVIDSRLTVSHAERYDTADMGSFSNETDKEMQVVLADRKRSAVYQALQRLSWAYGDRIDQGLARTLATRWLNDTFGLDRHTSEFNARQYQTSQGGITLLPYSSENLELSARVTGLGDVGFDETALMQYFFRILEDKGSSKEQVSLALYGLAALGEPVLPRLHIWVTRDDLSVTERLYLALALYSLGDAELARAMYFDIVREYAWVKEPHMIIKAGESNDEVLKNTELTAVLAALLNEPQQYGLWDYLRLHHPKEILLYLEELTFAKANLSRLSGEAASVTFVLNGETVQADLKKPRFTYSFRLKSKEEISIVKTEPNIELTATVPQPLMERDVQRDDAIGIRREYYVDGQRTNTFHDGDLIKVVLTPEFKQDALDGTYQITDILPSGLLSITKLYRGQYDCHRIYPYDRDGQYVKYMIDRNWRRGSCDNAYIVYYARVRTKGSYRAEPAVIQSMLNPDYMNFTSEEQVTIQ